MSRTYKDKPYKLHVNYWRYDNDDYYQPNPELTWYVIKKKTSKPKKRKEVDTEYHCMNTPSWWTRLIMNRPQRRAGRIWEDTVLREINLEDTDPPGVGRKPHIYYW